MKLQTGKIVTGEQFIGREEILKKINSYIDMSQSVVLVAPRRYGKSSIMRKVIDTKKGWKSIEIDIMKVYNKRDFADAIIDEAYGLVGIKNVLEYAKKASIATFQFFTTLLNGISLTIEDVELGLTFDLASQKSDDAYLLHALALPDKIAKKLGIHVLFAIDELGEIKELKEHEKILSLMRSEFQTSENITYIFAGSQYSLMNKIFTDKNSPFFRFAELVHVPPMTEVEFKGFLNKVFRSEGASLYRHFVRDIIHISGGIPYYIVKIAQDVLVEAKMKDKINTFPIHVCKAARKRYLSEEGYYLSELSKVKGKKYYIQLLKALSRKEDPYKELESAGAIKQNVSKILNALLDDGLIKREGRSYSIVDPFLARYIRKSL